MSRHSANRRGPSQGRPKQTSSPVAAPPARRPLEGIQQETLDAMGLPLTDEEQGRRLAALERARSDRDGPVE